MNKRMFPVYTGINRVQQWRNCGADDVPCIHRDKPIACAYITLLAECSLYTQG